MNWLTFGLFFFMLGGSNVYSMSFCACSYFYCGVLLPYSTDKTVQFQDFIYLSQVVQGLCIKAEAEHYRRYISDPDIMTRGTLYWQLVSVIVM